MNSRNFSLYIRAIQGHAGGNLIAPELMDHVAIPYKWREFLFHRGCSFDVTSILKAGLIAGRRQSKERRQTIFFTPLSPFGDNPDEEEPSDDLSKPRKVHYYSKSKNSQDAVYWLNSARAQDKGLRILADEVSCRNCIQLCAGSLHLSSDFRRREKGHYLKDSRRFVPHRRLYLTVLGNRSSSNSGSKTHQRVRLPAPGNWCVERNKVPQHITENYLASGN